MIIWTVKLISNVRKAIAGRKYPHQLAWAVAFGLLLGIVPHGNLLALLILVVVLSLKINHAMAAITAVGTTFAATKLDPYSHQVGEFVLTHPRLAESAGSIWQLPLMPWTDLNNTVVLGSFLIGIAALFPVFSLTYPVFRLFAPKPEPSSPEPSPSRRIDNGHEVIVVDQGHKQIARPHRSDPPQTQPQRVTVASGDSKSQRIDLADDDQDSIDEPDNQIAVETRIDVIRMKDYRDAKPTTDQTSSSSDETLNDDQQPMDEALNYLLRQLRDSQQRKAA